MGGTGDSQAAAKGTASDLMKLPLTHSWEVNMTLGTFCLIGEK